MKRAATTGHIPKIVVRNGQRSVAVDVAVLQRSAEKALRLCLGLRRKSSTQLERLPEIHVILISDHRMAMLHRKFLKKTGPTDVITFDHGEIFISAQTARRQARQFGTSLLRELQLYIVHALLHLHGFDDRDPRSARKMTATQERILGLLT